MNPIQAGFSDIDNISPADTCISEDGGRMPNVRSCSDNPIRVS